MPDPEKPLIVCIPPDFAGQRIDKALALLMPDHTRSAIQKWIDDGLVELAGEAVSRRRKLAGNESVQVRIPPPSPR